MGYWTEGKLGTVFQTYLDAIDVIESGDFKEDFKDVEKPKVLEAKKQAFGTDYLYYPPWSSKWK